MDSQATAVGLAKGLDSLGRVGVLVKLFGGKNLRNGEGLRAGLGSGEGVSVGSKTRLRFKS